MAADPLSDLLKTVRPTGGKGNRQDDVELGKEALNEFETRSMLRREGDFKPAFALGRQPGFGLLGVSCLLEDRDFAVDTKNLGHFLRKVGVAPFEVVATCAV
jgi:hypothetical protein